MRMASRRTFQVLALALGLGLGPAHASEDESLKPYQMVRSLQLVQDRIAGGDHAALPMQKKLLEMIDARFRSASNEEFEDHRNFRALMIYAMSGGNPSTIAMLLARLELDEADRATGAGVLGYLEGDVAQAKTTMESIEPETYQAELAAFLSLVKGSVISSEDPAAAISLLDMARLLGPGTLVEEAALRRTIALAVTARDGEKFMSASEQYARRFLRSPYASQYAESFVSGIIDLSRKLDLERIEEAIAWMTGEQAKTIYLRLARRSAIDGNAELLAFASAKAQEYSDTLLDEGNARSELYSSISSVTSDTVDDVLSRLQELDPTELSQSDRALLKAAKVVAAEVVAPVPEVSLTAAAPPEAFASPQVQVAAEGTPAPETTETEDLVTSARSKLEAIDKLLEETAQ